MDNPDKELTVRCECGDPGCFINLLCFDEDTSDTPELWIRVNNGDTGLWWRIKTAIRLILFGTTTLNEVVVYNNGSLVKLSGFLSDILGEDK